MKIKDLVGTWFQKWDEGDYLNIPIADDFAHTSPYGTINGKKAYLRLVEENKDKFLGNRIMLRDVIYSRRKACVRYTIDNPGFSMEVSEWIYEKDGLISKIIAYYNIEGEISEDRKISGMN